MNRKEVVSLITQEIVDKLNEKNAGTKKIKFLILANKIKKVKEFVENILNLEEIERYDFSFVFADEKFNVVGTEHCSVPTMEKHIKIIPDKSIVKNILDKFDIVLITDLTPHQLSSCANLIISDDVSNIVSDCIFNGRQIYIGIENFDGINLASSHLPYALKDVMAQHIRTLGSFGANLIHLEELPGILKRLTVNKPYAKAKKKIITKDDISSCFKKGERKIILYEGDIITALARDEAKKYGIEIEEDK